MSEEKSIYQEIAEELAVEHCGAEMKTKEVRIITFVCPKCGYEKTITGEKDLKYVN